VTTSLDRNIALFNLKGRLVGRINLNYPLPFVWKVEIDIYKHLKKDLAVLKEVQEKLRTKSNVSDYEKNLLGSLETLF